MVLPFLSVAIQITGECAAELPERIRIVIQLPFINLTLSRFGDRLAANESCFSRGRFSSRDPYRRIPLPCIRTSDRSGGSVTGPSRFRNQGFQPPQSARHGGARVGCPIHTEADFR